MLFTHVTQNIHTHTKNIYIHVATTINENRGNGFEKARKYTWEYLKRRKRRGTLYNFIIILKKKDIIKNEK